MKDLNVVLREFLRQARINPVPASALEVNRKEHQLGFSIPTVLRSAYLEVHNGMFGPGSDGILPVERLGDKDTLMCDPWPRQLLSIVDWGCAIWSCLDVKTLSIVTLSEALDSHGHDYWGVQLTDTGISFDSWLRAWADGGNLWEGMFAPGPTIICTNPFTKQPTQVIRRGIPIGKPWTP